MPTLSRPSDPLYSDEETTPDAVQLMLAATFNGLCRVISALGERRLLSVAEIEGIHDAMSWPLDDPDNRDDPVIATAREAVDAVLAGALARERQGQSRGARPGRSGGR